MLPGYLRLLIALLWVLALLKAQASGLPPCTLRRLGLSR